MSAYSRRSFLCTTVAALGETALAGLRPTVPLLTGAVTDVRIARTVPAVLPRLGAARPPRDIDLKTMAGWAMNYLIRTPRPELGYEPVFQCHPYACPPIPEGSDPVVACDTDARMDWEWYYMREVSGSDAGRDVETAFHKRMRDYIAPDGKVWSHPGCFNEGQTTARYSKAQFVVHVWGATKILHSLSEDFARTGNPESKATARKVMLGLKSLTSADSKGRMWFDGGMGGWRDGKWVPNGWNRQPAPIVEPLVRYWQATRDEEGLAFAKAYADGIVNNCQPTGIRFQPDGAFNGHSHATMHAVWGVGELGLLLDEPRYIHFAKGCWDFMLRRGTGTGWFPAGPDNCNETCCLSDMISVAAVLGRSGQAEYYDALERYIRNYISNLLFITTPEFTSFYRERNRDKGAQVEEGLKTLARFQGGIIGGSGLNDYENDLLGRVSGFEMFGCCAPEGMRAIYTAWKNTIEKRDGAVYVNLAFNRQSPWADVHSSFPEQGQLTVTVREPATFLLRPPSWAPAGAVRAFRKGKPVPAAIEAGYVKFEGAVKGEELTIAYPLIEFRHRVSGLWSKAKDLTMEYSWLGNMVVRADPPAKRFPLFRGEPRILPPAPV